jgi:type II secretory pathway component PulL
MDYQNEKSILLQKNFQDRLNMERLRERLELASLKNVPLDVRRKEANKPLFLTRYE